MITAFFFVSAFASPHSHSHSHPHSHVGDVTVLTEVPEPGFPEDVVVYDDLAFVSMPATFGTAGWGPSPVVVYDMDSWQLETTIYVSGEDTTQEHALVGEAIDDEGNLLVLSSQLGVLRFSENGQSWIQENLSGPFQALNPYLPSIPNGIVVLEDDSMLVTDSVQNVIWHVPAGGGVPSLWYSDSGIFFMGQMGLNALKMSPSHDFVYFADTERNRILRLPLTEEAPSEFDLEVVYAFSPGALPDGLSFDDDGDLWVVLAGENAVVKLDLGCGSENAEEDLRIEDDRFHEPSNLYFVEEGRALLLNHSLYTGDDFFLFEIYLGEEGDELPY